MPTASLPTVDSTHTDSLCTTTPADNNQGIAGEQVPYTLARDNVITLILAVCFVAMVVSVARSRRFISRQMRNFFHTQSRRTTILSETSTEIAFQVFLMVLTCLTVALVLYFYTDEYVTDLSAASDVSHQASVHYFLLLTLFLAFKLLLYRLTNWVFFTRTAGIIWMKSQLLLWALAGIVLYPVMLLVVYFHLQTTVAVTAVAGIVVIVETLSFYRSYLLFFKEKRFPLQNVLYLCTLEVVPLLLLYKSMVEINGNLSVNILNTL